MHSEAAFLIGGAGKEGQVPQADDLVGEGVLRKTVLLQVDAHQALFPYFHFHELLHLHIQLQGSCAYRVPPLPVVDYRQLVHLLQKLLLVDHEVSLHHLLSPPLLLQLLPHRRIHDAVSASEIERPAGIAQEVHFDALELECLEEVEVLAA